MVMWKYWEIDPETTNTHAVGVRSIGETCLGWDLDPEDIENITAFVRWDGCTFVDDNRAANRHICDLDDEIGRWLELRTIASDFFCAGLGVGGMEAAYVERYIREHHHVVDGPASPTPLAIESGPSEP